MVDIVDAVTRSRMMRGIRSKNTKPEILVRRMLHAAGFRYRLHSRELPGTPDIVLPKYKAIVFVCGCFWHGHDCPYFRLPATRPDFWRAKIERNKLNDLKAQTTLTALGWRHATVWECALRDVTPEEIEQVGAELKNWILSTMPVFSVRGAR